MFKMMQNNKIDFTMVICAYNPDPRLLSRCLVAVAGLDRSGLETEVLLVDNNSKEPVREIDFVKYYLDNIPSMQVLEVAEQGVQHARRAAIAVAKGNHTIYFDFDNEPEPDYLQLLKQLQIRFPEVAAWGPGHVTVDFIDGVDKEIEEKAKLVFQERHETQEQFASIPDWQDCYPFGTGLCMPTKLLLEYNAAAATGSFTMPGRQGNKLSSGEDTQMVLLAIKKGFSAGVSPLLRLQHIITRSRANQHYIEKLIYGTGECYAACILEVFPSQEDQFRSKMLSPITFTRKAVKKYLSNLWIGDPGEKFKMIEFLAANAGIYHAFRKQVPLLVDSLIKKLRLV